MNGAGSQLLGPPPASQFTGRAAYALSQLYYYLVAIVAIGFVIGGTIAALIAVRQLAWPDPWSVTRQSVEALLQGLAFAVPGALAAWWHLGQARKREGRVAPARSGDVRSTSMRWRSWPTRSPSGVWWPRCSR